MSEAVKISAKSTEAGGIFMIGKSIKNRFDLRRKLGEGGFGQVFLVYDQLTKEICALKLIRPELSSNKNAHDRFVHEARIWMQFGKHPNIVNVRALDLFNGRLFLALELVPPNELGNSLDRYLRVAKPTLRKLLKWALDICEGMIYARSKGLVAHRDLKPSNLMIDANGSIKLTDFGIAILAADPANKLLSTSPAGTAAYMAPEQFVTGAQIDEKSDIYSFGIVLYEMLSGGHLPFQIQQTNSENYLTYFHKLHLTFELPRFGGPLFPVVVKCLTCH